MIVIAIIIIIIIIHIIIRSMRRGRLHNSFRFAVHVCKLLIRYSRSSCLLYFNFQNQQLA